MSPLDKPETKRKDQDNTDHEACPVHSLGDNWENSGYTQDNSEESNPDNGKNVDGHAVPA